MKHLTTPSRRVCTNDTIKYGVLARGAAFIRAKSRNAHICELCHLSNLDSFAHFRFLPLSI